MFDSKMVVEVEDSSADHEYKGRRWIGKGSKVEMLEQRSKVGGY